MKLPTGPKMMKLSYAARAATTDRTLVRRRRRLAGIVVLLIAAFCSTAFQSQYYHEGVKWTHFYGTDQRPRWFVCSAGSFAGGVMFLFTDYSIERGSEKDYRKWHPTALELINERMHGPYGSNGGPTIYDMPTTAHPPGLQVIIEPKWPSGRTLLVISVKYWLLLLIAVATLIVLLLLPAKGTK
jgi:hypothetical protein